MMDLFDMYVYYVIELDEIIVRSDKKKSLSVYLDSDDFELLPPMRVYDIIYLGKL